jgi:DMSO/TMAO reductase YedYZ molybdopterin-dependent catalytic subunit
VVIAMSNPRLASLRGTEAMLVGFRWQTGLVPERDLLVLSEEPLNAETKLDRLRGATVAAGRHYIRTHFGIPQQPREIHITGAVRDSMRRSVTLDAVRTLPSQTFAVTLECAGNGRKFLEPPTPGEQWGLGAVGTAEWTGAALHSVLDHAWLPSAVEVLFRGADEGTPKDLGRRIAYERSLPIDIARGDDILVAYAMNGQPIPREHGGPLRLIVPSWYGMASVKWLAEIRLLDRPFEGFFQKDRYVIDGRPLRDIEPRAVIASPADGADVSSPLEVHGYAWSGRAPVERIDLSASDGTLLGSTTVPANAPPFAWHEFLFRPSLDPGEHVLVARATDREGNTQPLSPRWNSLGYANNGVRPTRIRVRR